VHFRIASIARPGRDLRARAQAVAKERSGASTASRRSSVFLSARVDRVFAHDAEQALAVYEQTATKQREGLRVQ
jgi:hypothetical protein